jgi:tetratricopeptide (TPR) repeat protein
LQALRGSLDRLHVRQGRVAFVTVGLALWLLGAVARADDAQGELQKAYSAYVAQHYDEAEARLRGFLDPKTLALKDAGSIADARMYLGAVLVAEGRRDESEAVFEQLLLDQPEYSEDPLRVKQDAIYAFIDVRTHLHDRLARIIEQKVKQAALERAEKEANEQRVAQRVATLERLASEERIIERRSRWIALVPFGAGQFQNGQKALGATFLTVEGLLVAGSVVGTAVALYNENQIGAAGFQDGTASQHQGRAERAAKVGDVFAAGFLLTAIAGVVHAELTFVPERIEIHKRPIPPLALVPIVGPGIIGLAGSF